MSGVLNSLKSLKFPNSVWKKKENEAPESDNKNKKKFKVSGFRKLMPTIPYMGNWTPLQSRHTHYIENEEENATDIMISLNKMRQEKLHCDVIYGDNKDKAAHKIVLSFNQKLLDLTSSTTQTVSVEIDNASFEAEPESETDAKVKETNDETSSTKELKTSTDDSNQEETQPEDGAGLVALLQDSSGGETKSEEAITDQKEESNQDVKDESVPVESESDDVVPTPLCAELATPERETAPEIENTEKAVEGKEESFSEEVIIPDAMTDPFDVIINFLYTSHIDITQRNVSALRVLAAECELTDVVSACAEFEKVLRIETCSMDTNEEKDSTASQFRYRYSDPSLPGKMLKHFNELRHQKKFTDVIVTSQSTKVRLDCHSIVLSCGSVFFDSILALDGDTERVYEVSEIEEVVLEPLVSFIYTGKVGVNGQNVSDLLKGADRMLMAEVIEGCAEYLETTINVHNCVHIRSVAIDYHCNKLKESAMAYIAEHITQVSRTTSFLLLSVGGLLEIMTSNDLHLEAPLCEGEVMVFDTVRRWVGHDEENRKQHLEEVMSAVRFPLISQQKLIDHVTSDLMVMENDALCGLITRVISQKPQHRFDSPVSMRGTEYVITLGGSSSVDDVTSEELGYTAVGYNDKVTIYDVTSGRFHDITTLPETRALHCVVACDQYIFVVGGFDSFSCIVNNVHCFDLASGKWEDMPNLRIKRSCFSLHVVSGCLFAVGGLTPNGYTASVERLDRRKKAWDMAAALPATRYRHAGCVYKNEILISGGCERLDSVLTYSPDTNEWKKCRPMNIGRDSHVMASANDKAFAIGGDGIAFSMEFYDGTIWTTIDIHCLFETLYLPSVGVVDDVIYLIGGWRAENEATCCVSYIDSKNRAFIVTSHTMPISLGSASSSTIRLPRNYWKRKFH